MSVLRFLKLGFLGQRIAEVIQSLGERFDDLLSSEETAGNDNVFYNPQDLTSLRVGTDGSGGSPAVGDPVGLMLDTSGLAGSMEEFLSSQPELVTNGTFDTDTSGWSGINATLSTSSGELVVTSNVAGTCYAQQDIAVTSGSSYLVSVDHKINGISQDLFLGSSTGLADLHNGPTQGSDTTEVVLVTATSSVLSVTLRVFSTLIGQTGGLDNVTVKEIPGNHAIAPTDAARPTLMDDPDTTWSSLTDDGTRGEELVTNGTFDTDSDWTKASGVTISGGVANFSNVATSSALYQSANVSVGETYEITADVTVVSGTLQLRLFGYTGSLLNISTSGTYSVTQTLDSANFNIGVGCGGPFTGTVDNISVRKVNTAFDERGGELVTNGTFDSDLSGWVATGAGTATWVSGQVELSEVVMLEQQPITTDSGTFLLSWDQTITAGTRTRVRLRNSSDNADVGPFDYYVGSGTQSLLVTTTAGITLQFNTEAGNTALIDNISVTKLSTPNLLLFSINSSAGDDDSTFDTDTGNWTKGTGWTISGGTASHDGTATGNLDIDAGLEANKWYRVLFYVPTISGGYGSLYIGSGTVDYSTITTTGWYSVTARADNNIIRFRNGVTGSLSIDNVIVQELPSTTPTSYYLDVDGVDDWMQVTPTLNLGEQWWHTGAWQADTENTTRCFAISTEPDASPLLPRLGNWEGINSILGFSSYGARSGSAPDIVTVEQADFTSLQGRVNGTVYSDIMQPYDQSALTLKLSIFSGHSGALSRPFDGRFYGGAWGQGQVDYNELTTLQDYLGTLVEPDINPTDVTKYDDVYQMLSAQTSAALFDIDDTTSLRVGRDGSGGVPVDGDPVGLMMDVSGAGGGTMAAYLEGATELVTNGGFDTDVSGWSAYRGTIASVSGNLVITENGVDSYSEAYQSVTTEAGKVYEITVSLKEVNGPSKAQLWAGASVADASMLLVDPIAVGDNQKFTFTASGSSAIIQLAHNNGAGSGDNSVWDNVSVKELPGYVATAPSDAARPTLASVLDETASELTDDGTRGAELVTNGDFGTGDTTGWTAFQNSTLSVSEGSLRITNGPSVNWGEAYQDISTQIGETYSVKWTDVGGGTGTLWLTLLGGQAINVLGSEEELTFVAASTTTRLVFKTGTVTNGVYVYVDNISVKKVQTVFDGRGDELVPNQFGAGWYINPSATVLNEQVTASSLSGNIAYYYSPTLFGVPRTLEVTFTISNYVSGFVEPRVGSTTAFSSQSANGTFTEVATVDGSYDYLNMFGSSFTGTISDVSVKEVLTPNLLLTSAGDDDSTFDTATGNWTLGAGWSITGGELVATAAAAINADYAGVLTVGRWYKAQVYVAAYTGGTFSIGSYGQAGLTTQSGTGWKEQYFLASHSTLSIRAIASLTADLDNVIVQEVPASVARAFYLDFDGVDDNLILDGTDFGSSTNATLYKTFRGDTADTQQIMFASTSWYAIVSQSGSAATVLNANIGSPVFREDGAIASYATRGDAFTALVDNTDHTIGVEEADLTNTIWGSTGFYIGGEYDTTSDSTGRLYSWAAVDTRLDGRNRALLENFMISRKTT